jgi:GNAT superfamily N-acetyltransferase
MSIRTMSAADVEPAAEAIRRGGWGERGPFFAFAVTHPECDPIVAEVNGEIVGTGAGTASGRVGWVGTIFVSPAHRGRGVGRALTAEVIARLEARGCRTLVLVATEQGRPIYERLGFEVQGWYHTLENGGLPADAPRDPAVHAIARADLPALTTLDRMATGEDRAHLIVAFVRDDAGWVVRDPDDGRVRAFLLRAPWGGGATIAPDPADALRLLDHRRAVGGPDHRVRAGLLAENEAGIALLSRRGWTEAWSAVRMARGDPLDWRPEAIWGQFNHAVG